MTWTQTIWAYRKLEHLILFIIILNNDISFNISLLCLKFPILLDEVHMEETCLRFFIQVLDFISSNVENKVLKNKKKEGLNQIF